MFLTDQVVLYLFHFFYWSLEGDRHNTVLSHLGGSDRKESAFNAEALGLIPRLGKSHGGGTGNPLQYTCLENSTDGGVWRATVNGVAKSQT